ncbi:uncharacterized protein LOC117373033 [Periophthalmus magnuspinnatus]|uniref:uncharacterized protein LOC117373033 n=1 Tax=Periophthalmus magnuspinnatus TaxID=409849 RepID=UPI0024370EC6|nr:uncharacterized protein LOC117373033 [Periophthalmus magnuspinnatus]
MSGGVNVKSAPRASSSGIPLPHSLLPSSPKADPRQRTSNQHRTSSQSPKVTPSHTPLHSPSPCQRSSGIPAFFARDHNLKSQLFQRTGALPVPQASRSAYSSPITQRRITPPHSKDTLDLGRPSYTQTEQNGNRNTYINKNQTLGTSNQPSQLHFRRGLNSNILSSEGASTRDRESNLRTDQSQIKPCYDSALKDRTDSLSQSDEEMRTPEDGSPTSSPAPLPPPQMDFNMKSLPSISVNQQDQYQQKEEIFIDTKVNMATVAPFSFRVQIQESDLSMIDELSDCSSGSIEICCDDITPGGMLEANVANISMTAKPRDLDLRSPAVPSTDYSSQAMASRKTMAKPSALPQGQSRTSGSELKVYRPTSGSIPIPVPNSSGLRKQRSLNNLCVLTDAEKKLHLYQSPRWNDDSTRAGPGAKGAESKAGQSAGRPPLSRTLSKSEQSLFQGKPKPFVSPAVTSNIGKPSRIPGPGKPRGPYAEVKPISKSSDHSPIADTDSDLPTKPNSNGAGGSVKGQKPGDKTRSASLSVEDKKDKKGVEGEGDKGFLKVDPELVVTVLGDLEQLLFSQMLAVYRTHFELRPQNLFRELTSTAGNNNGTRALYSHANIHSHPLLWQSHYPFKRYAPPVMMSGQAGAVKRPYTC